MSEKSKPWFSQRTRNILGAVLLVLVLIGAGFTIRNGMRRAAEAKAEAAAVELVARVAQADASDVLLRRHPEQYADDLTSQLLALLRQEQERYQAFYDEGQIAMSVLEASAPVREDADVGEGKALYRIEMTVDLRAHPTKPPGKYAAHTSILLHRDGDAWKVSQIMTILDAPE
jgi:hypothetical protein